MEIKIMVSSTREDLAQYREEASKIIDELARAWRRKHHIYPVSMEEEALSGDRESALDVSKRWVESADWLILIVAWHYGTIPQKAEAGGCSITESEYRHAVELMDKGPKGATPRKLFPFVAGEPNTKEAYRYSDGEKEDLKDWKDKQTPLQKKRLKEFKKTLKEKHIKYFCNLQNFRELLTQSLVDALLDLPPEVSPGSRLANVFLQLKPEYRKCMNSVELLKISKDIHDRLHDLRKYALIELQDMVLPMWRDQGHLSERVKGLVSARSTDAVQFVAELRGLARQLEKSKERLGGSVLDHQLSVYVDEITRSPRIWDPERDVNATGHPTVDDVAERINSLSGDVRKAFFQANRSMFDKNDVLSRLHSTLLERIRDSRKQHHLSAEEEDTIDKEIDRISRNRDQLSKALRAHNEWQEIHEGLETLRNYRDIGPCFEKELKKFVGRDLVVLEGVVDAHEKMFSEEGGWEDLQKLKSLIAELRERPGDETFEAVRSVFDNIFWKIDKRTLDEVDGAYKRVEGLEAFFDRLSEGVDARSAVTV
jgi:hypothetical protein